MVGPFMQGMLLIGIIYWYSKGIFNLINDYYRNEFQRKLKTDEPQNYRNTYDIDDIMNLIQMENLLNNVNKENNEITRAVKGQELFQTSPQKSPTLMGVRKKTSNVKLLSYLIYEYSTKKSSCLRLPTKANNKDTFDSICDISERFFNI